MAAANEKKRRGKRYRFLLVLRGGVDRVQFFKAFLSPEMSEMLDSEKGRHPEDMVVVKHSIL